MQSKMPSKTSTPRYKRPPSPYSATMSPRVSGSSKSKVWRSNTSSGAPSQDNTFVNNTREMWLKNLRQGTDMRREPIKAVHGSHRNKSMNASMASTPEYLWEKMGMTNGQTNRRRRNSVGGSVAGGSTSGPIPYKPQEDMYDEIMQLKKKLVVDKEKYDLLKSRLRRVEEENLRKDKEIEKFLDPTKNDQMIRSLAGGPNKSSFVLTGLKQRNLRLEQQLKEKENEVLTLRTDQKTTDTKEMKSAMEMYYQEVLRLQSIINNQNYSSDLDNSFDRSQNRKPKNMKSLRENVLRLTSENNELQSEIKSLKRDLHRALDGASSSGDESEAGEDRIKYSALSQAELVAMIKKMKRMQTTQAEIQQLEEDEEKERMREIIRQVKEERNQLRNENNEKILEIERLEAEYEKVLEENQALRQRLNKRERDYEELNVSMQKKHSREERLHQMERERKVSDFQKSRAAKSIQRNWRQYKTNKHDSTEHDGAVELLQSSFKGHLYRQQKMGKRRVSPNRSRHTSRGSAHYDDEVISETESTATDDNVPVLQAAMRGHLARRNHLKHRPTSPARSISSHVGSTRSSRPASARNISQFVQQENNDDLTSSDDDDVVVFGNFRKK